MQYGCGLDPVCKSLSERNLSVAYLITFSMHWVLLNVKTHWYTVYQCCGLHERSRYFHSLSLPLSLVWFTPAVWGGSGGSLLMKEDDCLKSCDDGCCRDDVEARETGVPVVYGRDWGAMAAIVNPLAAHLRRGERKNGKEQKNRPLLFLWAMQDASILLDSG